MQRHELLQHIHRLAAPRNYLEIGVADGRSLAISRVPSIAIDPAFAITRPLCCEVQLVRSTSDDFFARPDPIRRLRSGRNPWRNLRRGRPMFDAYRGGTHLDLAFIDGLHLFEFALRDFMNVERQSAWWTVIVFDDMLPRDVDEAARDRHTEAWAGDVYKLIPTLARYRPDLCVIPVDTEPTGILVVLGAAPENDTLSTRYDEIVREMAVPDPQPVPSWILERRSAVSPDELVASGLWSDLVRARGRRLGAGRGRELIRRHVDALGLARPAPHVADPGASSPPT